MQCAVCSVYTRLNNDVKEGSEPCRTIAKSILFIICTNELRAYGYLLNYLHVLTYTRCTVSFYMHAIAILYPTPTKAVQSTVRCALIVVVAMIIYIRDISFLCVIIYNNMRARTKYVS